MLCHILIHLFLKLHLYTPWKHKIWNEHWEKWLKRLEKSLGKKVWNSGNGRRCNGSNRSNHRRCSIKKAVPKNFAILTGKYLCWSLFFNKVPSLGPATKLERRLQHRCFPVNIAKSLRTPILKNICEWLLLNEMELLSRIGHKIKGAL